MAAEDNRKPASGKKRFWDAVEEFRREVDLDLLEPVDEIFESVRDPSPSRNVER